ncbi:ABC-2 family transporter protein [bacterium]|mgnify:FL=1|jgi:ABC-2 type transport system permease protein|nr:ABC transporter permease [Planctomicrobium sp.]MDA7527624.1 ABC-2 family transporter protein [bacterium]
MSATVEITPGHRFRVMWFILRTCISERLMYRADFAMGTLFRFLPIVTQIFLWGAIFAVGTDREQSSIAGYSYNQMISYYLIAMVGRAFSSMPGLASGIARQVRDGTIKKFLTQPIDMLAYLFWHRVAHKLVYYAVAAGPFAFVFWLCGDYLPAWPGWGIFGAFLLSLAMAFLMGFLIEALLGLISFWFLEVSSLMFIYMMMNYFLSGHMIPLDFLPPYILNVVEYFPFQYLAYVPPAILLGRYSEAELFRVLAVEFAWIIVLLAANRIAFRYGVKRYSAFGG